LEITVRQSNQLKAIAILMMLCLHLFNRNHKGLFEPLLFIGKQPLSYYISLFCEACVPVFAFVSGYGLYYKYQQDSSVFGRDNFKRLKKLYLNYWIIILIFPVILGLILKFPGYPGSWEKLVLNLSGLIPSIMARGGFSPSMCFSYAQVAFGFIWWKSLIPSFTFHYC